MSPTSAIQTMDHSTILTRYQHSVVNDSATVDLTMHAARHYTDVWVTPD